ncbi:hypothetical protein C8R44DRAFT_727936 [Mycena epipterygia]|nr:hypothetical protein C8R44DRAFT_727936 [Mycena epipterygia]
MTERSPKSSDGESRDQRPGRDGGSSEGGGSPEGGGRSVEGGRRRPEGIGTQSRESWEIQNSGMEGGWATKRRVQQQHPTLLFWAAILPNSPQIWAQLGTTCLDARRVIPYKSGYTHRRRQNIGRVRGCRRADDNNVQVYFVVWGRVVAVVSGAQSSARNNDQDTGRDQNQNSPSRGFVVNSVVKNNGGRGGGGGGGQGGPQEGGRGGGGRFSRAGGRARASEPICMAAETNDETRKTISERTKDEWRDRPSAGPLARSPRHAKRRRETPIDRSGGKRKRKKRDKTKKERGRGRGRKTNDEERRTTNIFEVVGAIGAIEYALGLRGSLNKRASGTSGGVQECRWWVVGWWGGLENAPTKHEQTTPDDTAVRTVATGSRQPFGTHCRTALSTAGPQKVLLWESSWNGRSVASEFTYRGTAVLPVTTFDSCLLLLAIDYRGAIDDAGVRWGLYRGGIATPSAKKRIDWYRGGIARSSAERRIDWKISPAEEIYCPISWAYSLLSFCAYLLQISMAAPIDSEKTGPPPSTGLKLTLPANAGGTAARSFGLGSRRASSPVVPLEVVEKGLKSFNEEQAKYIYNDYKYGNPLNDGVDRDNAAALSKLRTDGGTPSSAAFARERATEDSRFAARQTDGASPSTVTSQARRDTRIMDASPSAPAGFSLAPSSASRPVSRATTVPTIGSEEDLSTLKGKDSLYPAPPKDGKKAEASAALGVRTNNNVSVIAAHIVTLQQKQSALALDLTNTAHRLEGKIAHVAAGGAFTGGRRTSSDDGDAREVKKEVEALGTEMASVQRELTRLRSLVALHDDTNDGSSHDVVAVSRDVSQLVNEVKDEFGAVYDDIKSVQNAIRRLTAREENHTMLEARVDTLVTENDKLRATIANMEIKVTADGVKRRDLELQVWKVREAAVEAETLRLQAPTQKTAAEGGNAASGTRTFDLSNARKRGAPDDAETSAAKRARGGIPAEVGEKRDYKFWVQMGPVMPSVPGTPFTILKRMLKAALNAPPTLPTVFVEKNKSGTDLLIGFAKEADAVMLMRAWNDEPERPLRDINIIWARAVATKNASASGSGMTAREKEIAALSGN